MSKDLRALATFIVPILLFLAGCTKAVISVQLKNPPGSPNVGHAINSTRENFAAAAGVADLSATNSIKIKFSIGYNLTGNYADTNGYRIRATSAGVANEQ